MRHILAAALITSFYLCSTLYDVRADDAASKTTASELKSKEFNQTVENPKSSLAKTFSAINSVLEGNDGKTIITVTCIEVDPRAPWPPHPEIGNTDFPRDYPFGDHRICAAIEKIHDMFADCIIHNITFPGEPPIAADPDEYYSLWCKMLS